MHTLLNRFGLLLEIQTSSLYKPIRDYNLMSHLCPPRLMCTGYGSLHPTPVSALYILFQSLYISANWHGADPEHNPLEILCVH